MVAPPIYTPQTSQTAQPGYVLNPAKKGETAEDWFQSSLDYLVKKWAGSDQVTRDTFLGTTWNTAKFGSPSSNDYIGSDGMAFTSPSTVAVLTNYLKQYTGGDPELDSAVPYRAPAPNDYIESPEQIALRMSQANADRTFGLQQQQEARLAYGQQLDAQMQAASIAARSAESSASNAAQIAAATIGANASMRNAEVAASANRYGTLGGLLGNIYGTQGGMYTAGEGNRVSALGTSGSLSAALQQIYDSRTHDIIANLANPADWVQREYTSRALQAPTGTTGPMFRDVPQLSEAINRLLNYTPGEAPIFGNPGDLDKLISMFIGGEAGPGVIGGTVPTGGTSPTSGTLSGAIPG